MMSSFTFRKQNIKDICRPFIQKTNINKRVILHDCYLNFICNVFRFEERGNDILGVCVIELRLSK